MSLSFQNLILLFFFSFLVSLLPVYGSSVLPAALPAIGITYGTHTTHLPHPEHVVAVLESLKFTHVRIVEPNTNITRAFSYSTISLLLTIPNSSILSIASNKSNALQWLRHHVLPFYPRVRITTISVGNDILDSSHKLSEFLLPAIKNVNSALHELSIRKISVSTTFSFTNVISTAFPPSAAKFQESICEVLMKPVLHFLKSTNSSFLINLYPYEVYRSDFEIPIGYALFQEQSFYFRDDRMTGLRYRNLFDMMVDSVISAMALLGHEEIPVIVTETGWPSYGDSKEADMNLVYAEMYIKGLVRHLKLGIGTPLRREGATETYIFELFDEDMKQGIQLGRHWGILYPNMTNKYAINFSGSIRVCGVDDFLEMMVWLVVFLLLRWK